MRNATLALLLFISSCLHAQTTRVLFIGNSYTYSNDLPGLFTQLAASMGEAVETIQVAPGGYTFNMHTTYGPTLSAIAQAEPDIVVLQEQSQLPAFPPAQVETQCFPYAAQLVQLIRNANPCTEVVFLMTWGRENGDLDNCANYPPLCTYAGMQQRLRDSYVQMAVDNSAWCSPVGITWQAYRNAYPGIGLYTADGSHPQLTGSYIAASTLVSTAFRRSCADASFVPAGLDATQAEQMRIMASSVVLDSLSTWNIGVNDPVADADHTDLGGGTFLFANNSMGSVSQTWHFGDGSTSADADPLHTYSTEGTYTVTLEVGDACDRTDSLAFMITFVSSGTSDVAPHASSPVRLEAFSSPPTLHIEVTAASGSIDIYDTFGRSIARARLLPNTPIRLPLPHGASGLLAWCLFQQDLPPQRGKLLIP